MKGRCRVTSILRPIANTTVTSALHGFETPSCHTGWHKCAYPVSCGKKKLRKCIRSRHRFFGSWQTLQINIGVIINLDLYCNTKGFSYHESANFVIADTTYLVVLLLHPRGTSRHRFASVFSKTFPVAPVVSLCHSHIHWLIAQYISLDLIQVFCILATHNVA